MTDLELLEALKYATKPDSLRCLGCGYEHNCGIHGCKITRHAITRIRELLAERDHLARELGRMTEREATAK